MRVALSMLLVLLFASTPALAQEAEPEEVEDPSALEARALFERGSELAEGSRYSEASQAFARSLELVDRPSTAFNLAVCYFALDRHVEAIEVLDRYVASADPEAEAESLVDAARMLAHSRTSVAQIIVEVVPSDATVLVDGDAVEGGGTRSVRVNPGPHVVRVEAEHHAPSLLEVDCAPGSEQRRAVQLDSTRRPARLNVEVSERPLATILVDGRDVGTGSASLELEAGPHEVRVTEPERELPVVRQVALEWNERLRLELVLPDAAQPVSVLEEPAFWGVLGGTIGAALVGVLIGVLAAEVMPTPNGGTTGEVLTLEPIRQGLILP